MLALLVTEVQPGNPYSEQTSLYSHGHWPQWVSVVKQLIPVQPHYCYRQEPNVPWEKLCCMLCLSSWNPLVLRDEGNPQQSAIVIEAIIHRRVLRRLVIMVSDINEQCETEVGGEGSAGF